MHAAASRPINPQPSGVELHSAAATHASGASVAEAHMAAHAVPCVLRYAEPYHGCFDCRVIAGAGCLNNVSKLCLIWRPCKHGFLISCKLPRSLMVLHMPKEGATVWASGCLAVHMMSDVAIAVPPTCARQQLRSPRRDVVELPETISKVTFFAFDIHRVSGT